MKYEKTFSLFEFYEELIFAELEVLYELWNSFPKELGARQFELFFLFERSQQEKCNYVLDILRGKLSNNSDIFPEMLLGYYNHKKICQILHLKENYKDWLNNDFYKIEIECLEGQIYSHIDELILYYREVYNTLSVSTELSKDYSESDYVESSLIILLFDLLRDYKNVKNRFSFDFKNNAFINFYKNKGIDLLKEDKQYEKYGLLSISLDTFEFCTNQPFQLKDKRIDSTLYFNDLIPNNTSMNKNNHLSLKDYLWESLQMKKINQLSLLPEFNNVPSDGLTLSLEHFEKGNSFKINGLNKENVAKLFQEREYGNQLWAYMDGESDITFEEFNEEETKDYLDICGFYVTNVVHLKYFKDGDDYFIEHLDHEYVFYSPDEYKKRKLNHLQKGNAKKRIKTFKIDNSKIPLTSESGLEFLEFILKECLKHTDLIGEFLYS
jgi:hypothetical protein